MIFLLTHCDEYVSLHGTCQWHGATDNDNKLGTFQTRSEDTRLTIKNKNKIVQIHLLTSFSTSLVRHRRRGAARSKWRRPRLIGANGTSR